MSLPLFFSRHVSHQALLPIGMVLLAGLCFSLGALGSLLRYNQEVIADHEQHLAQEQAVVRYEALNQKARDYAALGLDVGEYTPKILLVQELIASYKLAEAHAALSELDIALDTALATKQEADEQMAEAEAKKRGTVKGTVKVGTKVLASVTVKLLAGTKEIDKAVTSDKGEYSITALVGEYTLLVNQSGYQEYKKTITLLSKQTTDHPISLIASTATPAPTATAAPSTQSSSSGAGSYEQKTVSTSRGTFTINQILIDISKGGRMVTDTADDSDCSNNCSTKSLQGYVAQHGGFAGMNGTYFCPVDYADCAGKTNTFYWKVYNSRLSKIINENNGLGEDDPTVVFTSDNQVKYYSTWKSMVAAGLSLKAGINSRPALVQNGQNILNENQLDSKQRTTKSNRGAIGVKGQVVSLIVAKSATVIDLAEIMKSLGVDAAMNLDGGGSSALYFNGAYKVGPGRSLPNAVVFKQE